MKQTTLFQILSDETRLRAFSLMHAAGEVCVCELVHALELSQPKVSRHMAAMRDAGLVTARRDAQWVFYAPNTEMPAWQIKVLEAAMLGVKGDPVINLDSTRLKTMTNRPERTAA